MATFDVITPRQAPPRPARGSPLARRMQEYEGYVRSTRPGQVGKLSPGAAESPRGVSMKVSRAARRLGKPIETWTLDGVVYFRTV